MFAPRVLAISDGRESRAVQQQPPLGLHQRRMRTQSVPAQRTAGYTYLQTSTRTASDDARGPPGCQVRLLRDHHRTPTGPAVRLDRREHDRKA